MPRRNFIDEHIFGRLAAAGVPHAGLSSDDEFVRRVYLDATGLPPSTGDVRAFVADRSPGKRDRLIDDLLGRDEFAEQWAWHWGDLLRMSNEAGPGANAFHYWFKEQLKVDRPYDRFVHDVLTPSAKVHATIPSLAMIGRSNQLKSRFVESVDDYRISNRLDHVDALAIDVSRVFLGLNTSCVSCHDGALHLEDINSYLTDRTRDEFFAMAAFFGKTRLHRQLERQVAQRRPRSARRRPGQGLRRRRRRAVPHPGREPVPAAEGLARAGLHPHRREAASGRRAARRAGPDDHRAPAVRPRHRQPDLGPADDRRLRRTLRRLRSRTSSTGKNAQPSNPELLEALAQDFASHGFRLKHTIRTILQSNAYQLSSRFPGEWKDDYIPLYPRHFARVLTGPEVIDAVSVVTGVPMQFSLGGEKMVRVKQLATPQDIGRGGEAMAVDALMQSFFQSNRRTPPQTGNRPSTLQALLMMKSTVVNDRVQASAKGRVAELSQSGRTDGEIVDELYLSAMARTPSPAEREVALRTLAADRTRGTEDLLWALLNSPEFLVSR